MKRVIFSVTATVVGIVALLEFKSASPVATSAAGLPSAGVAASATSGSATSTAAPPDPSTSTTTPSTSKKSPSTSASSTARTYVGSAEQDQYGVVQVKVTVANKKITNVAFVQLTAFDGRSQQINSGAAPILLQETLQAQSSKINSVSGASYTSASYVQSLQSALDKAGL